MTPEDPDTDSERVKAFVRQVNFGFKLGWADHESARILMSGGSSIPQTIVVGLDGRVVKRWSGYWSGGSGRHLKQIIANALSEAP